MRFVRAMASTTVRSMMTTMVMSTFRVTPMSTERKAGARICNSSIFGIVKHENFVTSFLYQHLKQEYIFLLSLDSCAKKCAPISIILDADSAN